MTNYLAVNAATAASANALLSSAVFDTTQGACRTRSSTVRVQAVIATLRRVLVMVS